MFDEPEEDTLMVEVMPTVTGKPADSAVFLKVLQADNTEVLVGVGAGVEANDRQTAQVL